MSTLTSLNALRGAIAGRVARTRALPAAVAGAVAAVNNAVYAALPAVPAGTPAGSDYMTSMRDYIGIGIGLIALIIAGYAFISVAGGSVAKFQEWRAGKAELGDLKMVFVIGALLLFIVIYVLTQAVGVIATSGTFAGS